MIRFSFPSKRKLAWLTLAVAGLSLPSSALAFQIVPTCATGLATPGLNCILEMFANVAYLILGVTGGLALIMFVYGGFMMLTSGGGDRAKKGIDAIKAAVVGIVIILMAGYLVRYGLDRLKVNKELLNVPTAPASAEPATGRAATSALAPAPAPAPAP